MARIAVGDLVVDMVGSDQTTMGRVYKVEGSAGETPPPVVVVDYSGVYMPLDGHHRMTVDAILHLETDAWVVDGAAFDDLDCMLMRPDCAENYVRCDGVPALKVSEQWEAGR
jgi:hypothetical protein